MVKLDYKEKVTLVILIIAIIVMLVTTIYFEVNCSYNEDKEDNENYVVYDKDYVLYYDDIIELPQ